MNIGYALIFPVTLLFAPMIIMLKNYEGSMLVSDQAERIQKKTTEYFHLNIARMIVLAGFSLMGALCGTIFSIIGSILGFFYQTMKVLILFFKVLFCCEAQHER